MDSLCVCRSSSLSSSSTAGHRRTCGVTGLSEKRSKMTANEERGGKNYSRVKNNALETREYGLGSERALGEPLPCATPSLNASAPQRKPSQVANRSYRTRSLPPWDCSPMHQRVGHTPTPSQGRCQGGHKHLGQIAWERESSWASQPSDVTARIPGPIFCSSPCTSPVGSQLDIT